MNVSINIYFSFSETRASYTFFPHHENIPMDAVFFESRKGVSFEIISLELLTLIVFYEMQISKEKIRKLSLFGY